MMRKNLWRGVQVVALALLAACSTDSSRGSTPLQPSEPQASLVDVLTALRPLNRRVPLAHDVSASATIGRNGGTLRLPGTGLTVTVPAGAVTRDTRFKVTALAGRPVAYEFEPHGITFRKPLSAEQDLTGTRIELGLPLLLKAGYFPHKSLIDPDGVSALVSETIPGLLDLRLFSFRWKIEHFSGYIVAW